MVIMKLNHFSFKSRFELIKFPLCLYIAVSSIFGFIVAKQYFSIQALFLGLFVLILACGCAALNNIQDKEYDSFFKRTASRVLVTKKINLKSAVFIAISFITAGLAGLFFFFPGTLSFLCGLFALICYNFFYTPLKKRTLLAIIPGTLSGMLPPLIGWTAAGSSTMDQTIIIIIIILGLWQIPHFFLLLLKTEDTLPKSKYPNFRMIFSKTDLKLQVLIWCGLYSLSMFFYLISGSCSSFNFSIIIALNALAIIFWTGFRLVRPGRFGYQQAFSAINISIIIFMASGIFEHII